MGTVHHALSPQTTAHVREFAAPASMVQAAHTDPALFVQWLGPAGTHVDLLRFEPVTGGAYSYVVRAGTVEQPLASGAWAFRGSYHLVEPGRMVHTWQFEDEPGVTLEDLRFEDLGGGLSRLTITSTHADAATTAALDEANMANEEVGANLERLALVLERLTSD